MDDANDMYLLRSMITADGGKYSTGIHTVNATKGKHAAHYTNKVSAANVMAYMYGQGKPYQLILAQAEQDTTKMQDQMYVLFTEHYGDRRYFVAATYDGPELTDDASMAAHYLNEEAADEAVRALSAFPETFEYETDGFWGDE